MPMRGISLRPSSANLTRICVHRFADCDFQGEVVNPYLPEPYPFHSIGGLLNGLETVMNTLSFPQAYLEARTFLPAATREASEQNGSVIQYMDDQTFVTKVGKQATFIVQIQFRQNATWQGTISWSEKKKTQHFRSTLEMIKLMDEAIEQATEEERDSPAW